MAFDQICNHILDDLDRSIYYNARGRRTKLHFGLTRNQYPGR